MQRRAEAADGAWQRLNSFGEAVQTLRNVQSVFCAASRNDSVACNVDEVRIEDIDEVLFRGGEASYFADPISPYLAATFDAVEGGGICNLRILHNVPGKNSPTTTRLECE